MLRRTFFIAFYLIIIFLHTGLFHDEVVPEFLANRTQQPIYKDSSIKLELKMVNVTKLTNKALDILSKSLFCITCSMVCCYF